jgi:hypothetical protein
LRNFPGGVILQVSAGLARRTKPQEGTMASFNGNHIENPDAYSRAVANRIKANRWTTGRRKLEATIAQEGPDFRTWLLGLEAPEVAALSAERDEAYDHGGEADINAINRKLDTAAKAYRARTPRLPVFLREALEQWGGLTDGQLTFARKVWTEDTAQAAERAAKWAAERAAAPAWEAGRQEVEATLTSIKRVEGEWGVTWKGMWKLEDGRRLYCTLPSTPETLEAGAVLRFKVTVEPAQDDATMAFGSRPAAIKPKAPKKAKKGGAA